MTRLMTAVRLGAVMLLAVAIIGATGIFSFSSVSAAGRAGVSKVPALFQGNGNKGGNGNGHGNGNGNAGQGGQQDAEQDGDSDSGHGKKAKKDKANKKAKSDKQAEDSADEDSHKNPQAGNVDCDDVEAMIEYLKNRNMNGATHANENGADNAALGALNKCNAPGQQGDDEVAADEEGTPVAEDGTPEAEDGTPEADAATPGADEADESEDDAPVSVEVDIDEDGNGEIRYDLDGDGEPDLTMIIEDGKVVEYVEASADDATPAATPDSTETA